MVTDNDRFSRSLLLLGQEKMERLRECRVILFGVGGVGSWCAESLVRTGLCHLDIVDFDSVSESNINRQLMATVNTVGLPKVEVLRERLLSIHPDAVITARRELFNGDTAAGFDLDSYDYVIDAIDSLKDKALLIERACNSHAKLFSSMGAALRLDPTRIQVAEFWKVYGDPLARALRNRFKREKQFPKRKFLCVFSDELLENQTDAYEEWGSDRKDTDTVDLRQSDQDRIRFKSPNGSLSHITAIFGFTLAGLVIKDICKKK